jgi:hypothetical protein
MLLIFQGANYKLEGRVYAKIVSKKIESQKLKTLI